MGMTQKYFISKDYLIQKYRIEKLSLKNIGKLQHCDSTTILRYLKKYKIKRRTISETNRNRIISKITCLKISKSNKGKLAWNKGIPRTNKEKLKISTNHARLSGKDHHRYNPYLSKKERKESRCTLKYRKWAKQILKLFNYTCQCCGSIKNNKLIAHHLEGWNWCVILRYDLNNGICLCTECHDLFHDIFGYGYNTSNQYMEFNK